MTHNPNIIIFATILLFLFSCTSDKTKDTSLYSVKRTTFEDMILIAGQTEPVNSTTLPCPPNADGTVAFIIEDGTYVKEGDVVCIVEDINISTIYDNGLLNLENRKVELEKLQANLNLEYALLEAQVRNNEAETQIALLDSLQLEYLTPTQRREKELQLERTAIEKVRYQKKLAALEIIQQSDVKKLELEIQMLARRVQTAEEQLASLTIKAPRDGLALRAPFFRGGKLQVGDVIWESRPVIILPDLEKMYVKIFAPEGDYKRINVGDEVMYTFDGMPENKAWGKIMQKSPVGQPLANINNNGRSDSNSKVKFFEITASIDSSLVIPGAGLSTNCHVYLQQLTDTIVIPSVTIFDSDSMKVVYVKRRNGFEMREIQTGISTYKNTVVVAGLNEKESIALIKPAEKMVKSRKLLPKQTVPTNNTDSIKHNE